MEHLEIIQSITLFVLAVASVVSSIKIRRLEAFRSERKGGFTDNNKD